MKLLKSRTVRENRQVQRLPVRVDARYRLDSHGPWLACRVIDVSVGGAALELPANASAPRSRLIFLELRGGEGQTGGVVLRADVRSLSFASNGHHRIGVKFVNVTSVEQRYLVEMINRSAELSEASETNP